MENGSRDARCVLCNKLAFNVCDRCCAFYCSINCQRIDWQHHKKTCIAMPCLVPAAQKFETNTTKSPRQTIPQSKFQNIQNLPSPNSRIILTGFRSANRCSVMEFEAKDSHRGNSEIIDAYGKTAPKLCTIPKLQSFAIAPYGGKFCRVQVLAVFSDDSVRVLFYDIGHTMKFSSFELLKISSEIEQLPKLTVELKLHNVSNFALSDSLKAILLDFRGQEYKITYGSRDRNVILYHWNTGKCLNKEITLCCSDMSTYGSNMNMKENMKPNKKQISIKNTAGIATSSKNFRKQVDLEPVMKPPFQIFTIPVGTLNEEVIVLDNSSLGRGYIGCVSPAYVRNIASVQSYLTDKFEDTEQPYTPKPSEYCIAKFDGEWYRAKVLDNAGNIKFSVFFIDYCNVATISTVDIRRYPADLKEDCRSNLCLIDALPEVITKEQLEFLQKEIPIHSKIVIDEVTDCEDNIITIEYSSIIKKMKANGISNLCSF